MRWVSSQTHVALFAMCEGQKDGVADIDVGFAIRSFPQDSSGAFVSKDSRCNLALGWRLESVVKMQQ